MVSVQCPALSSSALAPAWSSHSCLCSYSRKWKDFRGWQETVITELKASGLVNVELNLYWIWDYFSVANCIGLSFNVLITSDSPFQTNQGLIKLWQPKATDCWAENTEEAGRDRPNTAFPITHSWLYSDLPHPPSQGYGPKPGLI